MAAKKRGHRFGRIVGILLLAALILTGGKALLWGRWNLSGRASGKVPRVELTWEEAMADGEITGEELAVHYAPDILAAVNVLISESGRGDFLAPVDYDGDFVTLNNWEHVADHPLEAVVYYSVQETESHWFVGYYFYHPRDDAEIWLDRHENDMEGVMLAVRKGGFAPPEVMYTQGHGYVPFYFDDPALTVAEGSRRGGGLLLDGDRPVLYITPNGTLSNAGHSVESARDHSTYWAVGNSGVRYYHGGVAEEPATFKGDYEKNPCSYALHSLDELWARRNGPYGDKAVFGSYGAFRGEDYGTDKANPPWAWRNKTQFGYGSSFLADPAWTVARAVNGLRDFSFDYESNPYADWRVTVEAARLQPGQTLELSQDGWVLSTEDWWLFTPGDDGMTAVSIGDAGRQSIYVAAGAGSRFSMRIVDEEGRTVPGLIRWQAEYLNR